MDHPFRDLLDAYLFTEFPRRFGIPPTNAFMVNSYSELYGSILSFHGQKPIYTSHNAIYNLPSDNNSNVSIPYVHYVQMFWDIDDDNKDDFGRPLTTLEDALIDMRRIAKHFKDYNKMFSWSGNGFQFDLRTTPAMLKQDMFLSSAIKNFQIDVSRKINLRCVNLICAEPVHLQRIPACVYVKFDKDIKAFVKYNNYSIPLNEEVLEWDLKDIRELSMQRDITHIVDNHDKELYPISDVLSHGENFRELDIKDMPQFSGIDWMSLKDDTIRAFMKIILPNVVFNEVFGLSPRHKHKFVALVHMKQSGIAINDALQLLDRIAEMSMWDDVEDVKKRHQIVRQVYSSPYHIQVRA